MSEFFKNAATLRMPQSPGEGIVKALLLGSLLLSFYDISSESASKSEKIVLAYLMLTLFGAALGYLGKLQVPDNVQRNAPNNRP